MNTCVVIKYQFAYPNQTTYDMILLLDFFNAFRQFMAESRVNTFRQKVFGWTLKITRQPDFDHFSAEFKVTLRYVKTSNFFYIFTTKKNSFSR